MIKLLSREGLVPVPEDRDTLLCWVQAVSPAALEGTRDSKKKRSFIVKDS